MALITESSVTSIVDKSTATTVVNYNNVTTVTDNSPDILVNKESIGYIISDYKQGPAGIAEEDIMYAKRVDFITDNELYKGEAVPGTLDAGTTWRIRKITIATSDSDVVETWADGNDNFDNVWDDRLTYTYS